MGTVYEKTNRDFSVNTEIKIFEKKTRYTEIYRENKTKNTENFE
jgi:hypothetical protein